MPESDRASPRLPWTAGAMPSARPAAIARPRLNARIGRSMPISEARGILAGPRASSARTPAKRHDQAERAAEESRAGPVSTRSWRTRSRRRAPSAARRASSGRRPGDAREQQVGEIGAGDQEHEPHGGLQHEERPAVIADDELRERLETHSRPARVGVGIGRAQSGDERIEVPGCGVRLDPRPQHAEHPQEGRAAPRAPRDPTRGRAERRAARSKRGTGTPGAGRR